MNICKTLFFGLLFVCQSNLLLASDQKPLDHDEFIDKVYLVHATNVMMKDSTAVAGAAQLGARILPHDKGIRIRTTFHNCLGGLVPDECMSFGTSLMGIPFSLPKTAGNSQVAYAYLEPLKAFQGEVIGGLLNDCFIMDRHRYGENAIVILPETELDNFKKTNEDFPGQLVTYAHQTGSLRATIDSVLKTNDAWQIEFLGKPQGPHIQFPEIRVNGTKVEQSFFDECFKTHSIYQGHHNYSRFGIIENLLHQLNIPFALFHHKPTSLATNQFLPPVHATIIKCLIEILFDGLSKEVSGLSTAKQNAFHQWRQETREWIDLYFFMLAQLDNNKDIVDPRTFAQLISARGNSDEQTTIAADAAELPIQKKQAFMDKVASFEEIRFIPYYWDNLETLSVQELQEAFETIDRRLNPWHKRSLAASLLYMKKIFYHLGQTQCTLDPALISAFAEASHGARGIEATNCFLNQGPVECYRDEFFPLFRRADNEPKILTLMNVPEIKVGLAILLYAPEWNKAEELTLKDILPIAPSTKILFGEQTEHMMCVAFVRDKLLQTSCANFVQAENLCSAYCGFYKALSLTPLNENGIVLDGSSRSPFQGATLEFIKEAQPYFELIKSGEFSSLDEIFGFYGVQPEFRQKFPTDELFWNVPADRWSQNAPSFEKILKELISQKKYGRFLQQLSSGRASILIEDE
jgi:hypothetical protein